MLTIWLNIFIWSQTGLLDPRYLILSTREKLGKRRKGSAKQRKVKGTPVMQRKRIWIFKLLRKIKNNSRPTSGYRDYTTQGPLRCGWCSGVFRWRKSRTRLHVDRPRGQHGAVHGEQPRSDVIPGWADDFSAVHRQQQNSWIRARTSGEYHSDSSWWWGKKPTVAFHIRADVWNSL